MHQEFLTNTLKPYLAEKYTYNEQHKGFCLYRTRANVLSRIKKWIYDVNDNTKPFLWLTGEPGSGKSSIAATISRDHKDDKCLWAQYFFSRDYTSTTDPRSVFPSIALQLAMRSPDVAATLYDALQEKPSIL